MRIRIDEELGEDEKRDGEEDEDQDDECWAKLHFSTVFLVFQDQRRASKSLWLKRIICDPDAFYESHSHSGCVSQNEKSLKPYLENPSSVFSKQKCISELGGCLL